MKKIITTLLALAMILSMLTVANASEIENPVVLDKVSTSQEIDVKGTYVAGTVESTVYSVDIAWGSMEFTFTDAFIGTWNAETHEYDDEETAAWSYTENSNKITVTNHSNASIEAALSFNAEDEIDVAGAFYAQDDDTDTITSLKLDTAVDTLNTEAPNSSAYFKVVSGTLESDFEDTIGAITVTLSDVTASD